LARRAALSDDVWDAIRSLLMNQAITPGQHINIDQLAADLAVSQTPVREALSRLESDGLVRKRPQRGFFATELLTAMEIDEIFELRMLIEPWAAGRAAQHSGGAVPQVRAELARAVSRLADEPAEPYREIFEHDVRFHAMVYELGGNTQVSRAFERTHCHLHLLRLQSGAPRVSPTMAEHETIVAALEAGATREAEQVMRAHLRASRRRALAALSSAG
jgi:DNA-binding GntR family transcriptional regulator